MDAISYCRVSTEEQAQEGVSLAAQEARVRAYCAAVGLSLVESIRDEEVSAAKPLATRPGGAALLRALARRRARHVVVVTLDRAFRSTIDCLSTVQSWDRAGVSLHLVDHGGQSIATATAVGRMFLTMLAGFAEMEKRLIGERTAAAMRHQRAQGRAYARTPYGFDRAGEVLRPNPAGRPGPGPALACGGAEPARDRAGANPPMGADESGRAVVCRDGALPAPQRSVRPGGGVRWWNRC
jgi:DNA invertase Pin-like site-specific DNA recombinase